MKERAIRRGIKLFKFVTFSSNFCKEHKVELLNLAFKQSLKFYHSTEHFPHSTPHKNKENSIIWESRCLQIFYRCQIFPFALYNKLTGTPSEAMCSS